ncbi:MAG: glycerophosphodiester phosphodiesterase [Rikenellaceae bacterium]|nr:glycerophosphodiester phosphodiesterase [Rikenellaceae bacterium]
MGQYKQAVERDFYFAAKPSPGAREVEVVVTDRFGNRYGEKIPLRAVEVQAHRGGMGLWPENTIQAMLNAVRMGVHTLEMDLQITRDNRVVVCHDPVLSWRYASRPDGRPVEKDSDRFVLYHMKYDSLRRFDVGTGIHPNFPDQEKTAAHIPLLSTLIDAVESYTRENNLSPVHYNIEIKSSETGEAEGIVPDYKHYTDLVMQVLTAKNLGSRLLVQCSDVRTLDYLHRHYPQVRLAYLIAADKSDFEANMSMLSFTPECYSPNHSLVDQTLVDRCRRRGMTLIPWTVDQSEETQRLVELQVDGIITNYPDRLLKITRKILTN